jgi:hypothetical protein
VGDSGLIRTATPGSGRPTQTPSPVPAASISARETSVTGSASVIPYGVCISAAGSTSRSRRSSAAGTGAPADMSSRTPASADSWSAVSPPAVATTRRSAAGAAKTTVASTARTASARRAAVSVPGAVTSTSGTEEAMPSAGPRMANGANAATNRSAAVSP